jgi:HK97 family phage prohead protease
MNNEYGQPIETRDAKVADVSFPRRLIEVVVVPFEAETVVEDRDRTYREVISRGAFGSLHEQKNRVVQANRDHELGRLVGRAVSFDPDAADGLIAKIRASKTPLGEETLEYCADGLLGASAGFTLLWDKVTQKVRQNAEVWETRSRRRLNHLWLHHVAFTPQPAYPGAKVLSVRTAPEPEAVTVTPNLERLRIDMLRAEYERLDARWLRR